MDNNDYGLMEVVILAVAGLIGVFSVVAGTGFFSVWIEQTGSSFNSRLLLGLGLWSIGAVIAIALIFYINNKEQR
ncbi:MAG: hypothetical protein SVV03_00650 [Candidatus Nanohaloarchaea archaeon]|nr:hypothetical protein [Candidatus Nanohaloarchaea archaeon]